jgi:hypothetical protein
MLIAESMSCCIWRCTSMLSRYDVPMLVAATLPRCAGGRSACGEREGPPEPPAELDIERWCAADGRFGSIWICRGGVLVGGALWGGRGDRRRGKCAGEAEERGYCLSKKAEMVVMEAQE